MPIPCPVTNIIKKERYTVLLNILKKALVAATEPFNTYPFGTSIMMLKSTAYLMTGILTKTITYSRKAYVL
jgi:hypothetical protein